EGQESRGKAAAAPQRQRVRWEGEPESPVAAQSFFGQAFAGAQAGSSAGRSLGSLAPRVVAAGKQCCPETHAIQPLTGRPQGSTDPAVLAAGAALIPLCIRLTRAPAIRGFTSGLQAGITNTGQAGSIHSDFPLPRCFRGMRVSSVPSRSTIVSIACRKRRISKLEGCGSAWICFCCQG